MQDVEDGIENNIIITELLESGLLCYPVELFQRLGIQRSVTSFWYSFNDQLYIAAAYTT